MALTETINEEIKKAMLAKNEAGLRALRSIKSALLLLKTDKGNAVEVSEDDEVKMLQKLVKQRKESIDIYKNQNREDLALSEKEELEIIEKFLPAKMDMESIRSEIKKIIEEVGAASQADFGKVMGAASKKFAGKADNKDVSAIIRELLS